MGFQFPPNSFLHPASCSGEQSSSGAIFSGGGYLTAVMITTDGVNDVDVVIYDNIAASGKVVRRFKVAGDENFGGCMFNFPILIETGVYLSLSGSGGGCIVDYIN